LNFLAFPRSIFYLYRGLQPACIVVSPQTIRSVCSNVRKFYLCIKVNQ